MPIEKIPKTTNNPITLVDDSKSESEIISNEVKKSGSLDEVLSQYTEAPKVEKDESKKYSKGQFKIPSDPDVKGSKKITVKADTVITGSMVLLFINITIPGLIAAGHNKWNTKKYKHISRKDLKLSKEQLRDIEPIADEFAKTIDLTAHPALLLGAAMISVFATSYISILEPKVKEKTDESKSNNKK